MAVAFAFIGACAKKKEQAACADASDLNDAQESSSASLHYTDHSIEPGKSCGACTYFLASADGPACGRCEILNRPVSTSGYCTSWSRKA